MRINLYRASALAVVVACAPHIVLAQSTAPAAGSAAQGAAVEEVVVTGSRVARVGFVAPTPVTAVSTEQLKTASPGNIAESLRQLPILSATTGARGATGSAGNGGSFLNLRRLGGPRTLTLLDGRRFVATNQSGTVDTSLFPQALVSRVEIVTGGASAAYGSDAVAGVVNFILDKSYEGLKGEVMLGVADEGDGAERNFSLSGGRSFAEGRGHLLLSGEYYRNEGLYDVQQREWGRKGCVVIPNPAGPTARTFACDVRSSNGNFGGLISTGPLRGTTFDTNGNPIPFNFGTLTSSTTQVGGDGILTQFLPLVVPATRASFFGRASWDITDTTTAYVEANYGLSEFIYQVGSYSNNLAAQALTIFRDNAYLTPAFRAQLVAQNIQSFRLGRYYRDLPRTEINNLSYTTRIVAGLDGELGGYKWSAYYQHGENRRPLKAVNAQNLDRFQQASDAVVGPGGQIVCRSTLTNPGNGCVPFNVIGEHTHSAAVINYITGTSWSRNTTTLDVAAAEINGEPFTLPAGPVSIAAGLEYRKEGIKGVGDPDSNIFSVISNAFGPYRLGNYLGQNGEYDVSEGFVETVVPIIKDQPFFQAVDFNGAVRRTTYSTSGTVNTWKAGLTWKVADFIRFRSTRSRDIRAPNLNELFNAGQTNRAVTFIDQGYDPPRTTSQVLGITRGNPDLDPEIADTLTLGVVISPTFAPSLDISIDTYDIEIAGAIAAVGGSQSTLDCRLGDQAACARVVRDAAGNVITTYNIPVNQSVMKASGVDMEVAYRTDLSDILSPLRGALTLRWLGNWVSESYTLAPGARIIDRTGDSSQPEFRWTLQAAWRNGPLNISTSARYTGSGPYDSTTTAADLPQKTIDGQVLVDSRINYEFEAWGGSYTAYLNVQNLFNQEPPEFGPDDIFDSVGRYFRVGLNFKY